MAPAHQRLSPLRRLALLGVCLLLAAGCSRDDALVPATNGLDASRFAIGQPRDFFLRRWGEPLPGAEDRWQLESGTAAITFHDGRASVIQYVLPTADWTDDQIRSALASNGFGWHRADAPAGGSFWERWEADLLRDFGAPSILCFVSQDGTQASVFANTLTIRSTEIPP
jgi:hypothetical protein